MVFKGKDFLGNKGKVVKTVKIILFFKMVHLVLLAMKGLV